MRICSIPNCNKKHRGLGYCEKHYCQFKKYGKIKRTKYDPNEIIIEDNNCRMKLYNINCEEVTETIFDLKYKEEIEKYKWHICHDYVRSKYRNENNIELEMSLHGFIIYLSGQIIKEDQEIDHKDNNPLNNLENNLRICSHIQNSQNKILKCDNTSGWKGVSYYKQHKKWGAYISNNKQREFLGLFLTAEDAAKAYNTAAIKYFGEFAVLNIIP